MTLRPHRAATKQHNPSRLATTLCHAALMLLVAAPIALATYPAFATQADQAIALKKFEEGRLAFERGKFEQALVAFQVSIELLPSPNSRLYIARCYRALGKPASAYVNFRQAMREAQDRFAATNERRYNATRDAASREAAEIESKVPRLTVAVPSDAPRAMILSIDGDAIPRAAWGSAIEVDPGNRDLLISGGRVRPIKEHLTLRPGEQKRIELRLERLPTSTVVLTFKFKPAGVAVEIDGKSLDPQQFEADQELDVGPHAVIVHAPGYAPFIWKKSMADGERTSVRVDLGAARGTPSWLFLATTGVAATLAGSGAYFAVKASDTASKEIAKDPLLRDPAIRDNVRSNSVRANGFFIAGGAAGVGAAILAFTTDWKGATRQDGARISAQVCPYISPNSAGISLQGYF